MMHISAVTVRVKRNTGNFESEDGQEHTAEGSTMEIVLRRAAGIEREARVQAEWKKQHE